MLSLNKYVEEKVLVFGGKVVVVVLGVVLDVVVGVVLGVVLDVVLMQTSVSVQFKTSLG